MRKELDRQVGLAGAYMPAGPESAVADFQDELGDYVAEVGYPGAYMGQSGLGTLPGPHVYRILTEGLHV